MAHILKIGHVDSGNMPADLNEYFKPYHQGLPNKFRGEKPGEWSALEEVKGTQVKDLQQFLRKAGFFPKGEIDGIFGYRTRSAVRLFQEYVRNVEGLQEIGDPTGVVDSASLTHIKRWVNEGRVAEWAAYGMDSPTKEYYLWINYLNKVREFHLRTPQPVHKISEGFKEKADSSKPELWDFHPKHIHLVGIRRKCWEKTGKRLNDDVFILLINGMIFKFLGTTDASTSGLTRGSEPFITHGQHLFTLGWTRMQLKGADSYAVLRPAEHGVFVADANSINPEEPAPDALSLSKEVQVNWAGNGANVWVPGSQGISGKSYIGHNNEVVRCNAYSAANYKELASKTKGAYNLLMDLISVYSDPSKPVSVRYSVIHEKDLGIDAIIGNDYADKVYKRLRK